MIKTKAEKLSSYTTIIKLLKSLTPADYKVWYKLLVKIALAIVVHVLIAKGDKISSEIELELAPELEVRKSENKIEYEYALATVTEFNEVKLQK